MKFMILMSDSGEAWERLSAAQQAEIVESHGEFQRALEAEGKFVASARLAPAAQARTVSRAADGGMTVTDGPFAESKEVIGGYYIIEAASLEEAVDWAKRVRFMSGWNEVRPLYGG
jgi:hypothetical protein